MREPSGIPNYRPLEFDDREPTEEQLMEVGAQVLDELEGRSGFDALFEAMDDGAMDEVELRLGRIAYRASRKLLVGR